MASGHGGWPVASLFHDPGILAYPSQETGVLTTVEELAWVGLTNGISHPAWL